MNTLNELNDFVKTYAAERAIEISGSNEAWHMDAEGMEIRELTGEEPVKISILNSINYGISIPGDKAELELDFSVDYEDGRNAIVLSIWGSISQAFLEAWINR